MQTGVLGLLPIMVASYHFSAAPPLLLRPRISAQVCTRRTAVLDLRASAEGEPAADDAGQSLPSWPPPPPPPAAFSPIGPAVLVLLMLGTINQWARALIFYTVDFKTLPSDEAVRMFMNVDIGFDEAQYGVLASIGFAAVFSVTSLFAGGLVDRVDSRNLLAGTSLLWSTSTVATGAVHSFPQVLGARVASGVGQAFANPASYTILGRLYSEEQRATVNGLFASSVYLGGGLAALSVILDERFGWRSLYMFVGGLALAATAVARLSLPAVPPLTQTPNADDARPLDDEESDISGEATPGESSSLIQSSGAGTGAVGLAGTIGLLSDLASEPTVRLLLLASTLRFLAGFTIGVWVVPFYREQFPGSIGAEFALIKACVNGVAGSVSATGGGIAADRLSRKDERFQLWVPAIGSMLAIPCWLATLGAPTLETSLAALFAEYLFAECWFGPTVAGLQAAAPPQAQGLTTGVFSCLTFVGNLAPFIIGLLVKSGDYNLPELLSYSVPLLYAASAVAFVAAAQTRARGQRGPGDGRDASV
jgi:predicted MFS family arabinose efflux permease